MSQSSLYIPSHNHQETALIQESRKDWNVTLLMHFKARYDNWVHKILQPLISYVALAHKRIGEKKSTWLLKYIMKMQ